MKIRRLSRGGKKNGEMGTASKVGKSIKNQEKRGKKAEAGAPQSAMAGKRGVHGNRKRWIAVKYQKSSSNSEMASGTQPLKGEDSRETGIRERSGSKEQPTEKRYYYEKREIKGKDINNPPYV